jgi:hypothetical protein
VRREVLPSVLLFFVQSLPCPLQANLHFFIATHHKLAFDFVSLFGLGSGWSGGKRSRPVRRHLERLSHGTIVRDVQFEL